MHQRTFRFGLLSACSLTVLLAAGAAFAGPQTTLCHAPPPGNADNAHGSGDLSG